MYLQGSAFYTLVFGGYPCPLFWYVLLKIESVNKLLQRNLRLFTGMVPVLLPTALSLGRNIQWLQIQDCV